MVFPQNTGHNMLPRLSGGGPVKFQNSTKSSKRFSGGKVEGLPLLANTSPRRFVNREKARFTARSNPTRKTRRFEGKESVKRNANSAPTHVNNHRLSNHDRQESTLPQLSALHNEAHGVPTIKQTRTTPKHGGKGWASSWAEVRATSLQREQSQSGLPHSPDTNSSYKTDKSSKSCHSLKSSKSSLVTFSSTVLTSKSEPNILNRRALTFPPSKNKSILKKTPKSSPFYAKKKTEITFEPMCLASKKRQFNSYKFSTNDRPQEPRRPPPLLRQESKVGFFARDGAFVRDNEEEQRAFSVEEICPNPHPKRKSKSQSARGFREHRKPKLRRRSFVVTKKTLSQEKSLNSMYVNTTVKIQRHLRFLKQLEEAQRSKLNEYNKDLKQKEKRRIESAICQREELKNIRDRFDEEQVKRFNRQYVSWKSVETDRLNRASEQYGLPDNIYDDRYDKTLKVSGGEKKNKKRQPKKFKQYATWVKNLKTFEKVLNPQVGYGLEKSMQKHVDAIIEGIDTVELTKLGDKSKKVTVKRVLGSAQRVLDSQQTMDAISEVSSAKELADDLAALNLENDDDDNDSDFTDVDE